MMAKNDAIMILAIGAVAVLGWSKLKSSFSDAVGSGTSAYISNTVERYTESIKSTASGGLTVLESYNPTDIIYQYGYNAGKDSGLMISDSDYAKAQTAIKNLKMMGAATAPVNPIGGSAVRFGTNAGLSYISGALKGAKRAEAVKTTVPYDKPSLVSGSNPSLIPSPIKPGTAYYANQLLKTVR